MDQIPEITVADAKERLEKSDAVFIDIRDPDSYAAGHIPQARHVHDGNVEEFIRDADKAKTVIVYCYHGNSSLGGANHLISSGFADVYSMAGGFTDWIARFPGDAEPVDAPSAQNLGRKEKD